MLERRRIRMALSVFATSAVGAAPRADCGTAVSWITTTGNWSTATNWSPNGVPTNSGGTTYNVAIGPITSAPYTVTISNGKGYEVDNLNAADASGTVSVTGSGYLTINGSGTFAGRLALAIGDLGGAGTLTINGGLTVNGGIINSGGKIVLAAGSRSSFSFTSDSVAVNRPMDNAGTLTMSGSPWGCTFTGVTFNNLAGGAVAVAQASIANGTGSVVNNYGTWTASGPFGTGVPFNNYATVTVTGGTTTFSGGGTNAGTITVQPAATAWFYNTYAIAAGSALAGGGTALFTNGTITFPAGTYGITGPLNLSGGTVTFNGAVSPSAMGPIGSTLGSAATFNDTLNYSGALTLSGGVTTFARNQTFSALTLSGGSLSGPGTVTVTGKLTWGSFGAVNAGEKLALAAGSTATITPAGASLYGTLENAGTVSLSSPWQLAGGTVNNLAGGVVNVTQASIAGSGAGAINNYGTWTKTGATVLAIGVPFNNSGNFVASAGTTSFTGGGTSSGQFSVAGGSTITFSGGHVFSGPSVLNGAGTVAFSTGSYTFSTGTVAISGPLLFNGGPVSVPGALSVPGTVTVSGSGSLTVGAIAAGSASVISTLSLSGGPGTASHLGALAIANDGGALGSRAYTGRLDLKTGELVVSSGSEAALRDAAAYYASHHTGGIGSSATTAITSVGIIANANGAGRALHAMFGGVAAGPNELLVRYTYVGDTDLTGSVDGNDLANLLAGMSGRLAGWINGDVSYDGVVNATDLNLLIASLKGQGAPLTGKGGAGGGGAVPEPAGAGVALLGASALTLRRRR